MSLRPSLSPVVNVLAVGLLVQDIVCYVDHYPQEDESIRTISRQIRAGGNASNSLTVLSQLASIQVKSQTDQITIKTSLLASLGSQETSQSLINHLESAYGIDTSLCLYHEDYSIPTSYILVSQETGSRTIIHHRDNLPEIAYELISGKLSSIISSTYHLCHFEGRSNIKDITQMMEILTRNKQTTDTAVHPSSSSSCYISAGECPLLHTPCISLEIEKERDNILDLLSSTHLVFISKEYAKSIIKTTNSPKEFLSFLSTTDEHQSHSETMSVFPISKSQILVCLWGSQGAALLSSSGEIISCPAVSLDHVEDSVGAGDTFIASFLYAVIYMRNELSTATITDTAADHIRYLNGCYLRLLQFSCQIAAEKCRVQGIHLQKERCQQHIQQYMTKTTQTS